MADVYVEIGKILTPHGKVPEDHAKAAAEGVRGAIEKWVRKTPGFTTVKNAKGYHVSATIQKLDIELRGSSAIIQTKLEVRVAHLPQVVRPRAVLTNGAGVQGSARNLDAEVRTCTEAAAEAIANGKMATYMTANKSKL
jgi:hypothetical protein